MANDADNEPDLDDELITCWCGARGTYDQLFDDTGLDSRCGGSGELHCDCGGDFCVCHYHGSTECPGCEDCEGDVHDDYEDDWWDDHDEQY